MALKFPPPPYLASRDADTQRLNRWLLEIQSILNSAGAIQATAVTQPVGDNTTNIATTAFVKQNTASSPGTALPLSDATPAQVGTSTQYSRQDHVHPTDASRAPLASPGFTGTPTAPTATPLTGTAQLATTAYADAGVLVERNRAVTAEALLAPLASPSFTGSPTAPTVASVTDATTNIATTAFTQNAIVAALAAAVTVLNGSGVPANALGIVNDWYADTTNKHIYVKTAAAVWTLII